MSDKSQIDKFREKARELECDESEEAFDLQKQRKKAVKVTSPKLNPRFTP